MFRSVQDKICSNSKKSVLYKCDNILYLHFISKYAKMKVFIMGRNVKLFQAERNVNCVLSFLSSVREANLPPKKHFLTILNYILLKNTKKVLQIFEKQLSQFKCSAS